MIPQDWALEFWYVKGFVALVATVLLVIQMQRTWSTVNSSGQRLRYLSLLYFAVLVTAVSVDQVSVGDLVTWRNLGAFFGVVLLLITACVSLRERRH